MLKGFFPVPTLVWYILFCGTCLLFLMWSRQWQSFIWLYSKLTLRNETRMWCRFVWYRLKALQEMIVLSRDSVSAACKIPFPCFEAQMEGRALLNQVLPFLINARIKNVPLFNGKLWRPSNSFIWFCGELKGAYWDFFLTDIYVYFLRAVLCMEGSASCWLSYFSCLW